MIEYDKFIYGKLNTIIHPLSTTKLISKEGVPTDTTEGKKGWVYEDVTTSKLYQCTAVDLSIPKYTWTLLKLDTLIK